MGEVSRDRHDHQRPAKRYSIILCGRWSGRGASNTQGSGRANPTLTFGDGTQSEWMGRFPPVIR
jgi:hypothetical protein